MFTTSFWTALLALLTLAAAATAATPSAAKPIPVIFDTDIGDDIDDTWALAMLLKSPELDVKLVVGDNAKSLYRAKLIAKLLETAGRTDIPVGVGVGSKTGSGGQAKWVADYDLKSYPGTVHEDGVQALIDTIMKSPTPITLIAVGPVTNLKVALEREPKIAERARFIGMHGSVRLGYNGGKKIAPEYNVKVDVKACQAVFTAPWDITITPLDTCGLIRLRGAKFTAVRDSKDTLAAAVMANYRLWERNPKQAERESSVLFDTVAVYLAFADALCEMETLGIRVDDKGYTRIDPKAKTMRVAAKWKDMGKFEDLLVQRIIGPTVKAQP
ncbi:nucleoside hydrolase [bacterium]|nr:nucleoside hydrolase [bacterium]